MQYNRIRTHTHKEGVGWRVTRFAVESEVILGRDSISFKRDKNRFRIHTRRELNAF